MHLFTHSGFFSNIFSLNHHKQRTKCFLYPFYIKENRINDEPKITQERVNPEISLLI